MALALVLSAVSFAIPAYAASQQNMSATLIVGVIPPVVPTGLSSTLAASGQGLAGFLTYVENPLVTFLLLIGICVFCLGTLYVIVDVLGKAFSSSPMFPREGSRKKSPYRREPVFRRDDDQAK